MLPARAANGPGVLLPLDDAHGGGSTWQSHRSSTTNLRRTLLERKAELTREVEDGSRRRLEEDAYRNMASEVGDAGDASTATEQADLRNSQIERDVNELRAIDAALARFEEGTYGHLHALRRRDRRGAAARQPGGRALHRLPDRVREAVRGQRDARRCERARAQPPHRRRRARPTPASCACFRDGRWEEVDGDRLFRRPARDRVRPARRLHAHLLRRSTCRGTTNWRPSCARTASTRSSASRSTIRT